MYYSHFDGMSVLGEDGTGQSSGGLCEDSVEGHHEEHGEAP